MVKSIKISNKTIGENQSTFIIAEAGVNHNGDIKLAKKLVDVAVKAGADAIKFQTYKSENLVTKDAKAPDYMKTKFKQIEMIKKFELSYKDFEEVKKYCDKKKIIFLSTPHSFDAIDFLEKLVPAYKFGSGDITNIPDLKYAAKKGKTMILGTGMSTLKEIKKAVDAIKLVGNKNIILLHATTNYPCLTDDVNLRAINTMKKKFDLPVGYSDHTVNLMVSCLAVAMGATVIEKHFTIDKKLPGPDHKASLNPDELIEMIQAIRNTERVLGSSDKKPTKSEKKIMKFVRKSLVAKKDIKSGEIIKKDMIIIKRPGIGLSPSDFDKIVEKKAKRMIKKDEVFRKNMVE